MRNADREPDLNPAAAIISKCGGDRIVAMWLGIDRSQVIRFRRPVSVGGRGGLIPSKYQRPLLEAAKRRGVDLDPMAFFGKPTPVKQRQKVAA